MNVYTADSTVIAAAQNAVANGATVFIPSMCGTFSTWRQRRLFEAAMLAAQWGTQAAADNVQRFRVEAYRED